MKLPRIPASTVLRTVLLSYVSFAVGVGLVVISVLTSEPAKTLTATFGSAILALGVVSFASDHFLRSATVNDMLRMFNIKQSLFAAGVEDLVPLRSVEWEEVVKASKSILSISLRPRDWLSSTWPAILALAKTDACSLAVYLPPSESCEQLARRLGLDPASYAREIEEVRTRVQQDWERERDVRKSLKKKSSISLVTLLDDPGHSVVQTDSQLVVTLEPFHPTGDNTALTAMLVRRRDVSAENIGWLENGISDLLDLKLAPDWAAVGEPLEVAR